MIQLYTCISKIAKNVQKFGVLTLKKKRPFLWVLEGHQNFWNPVKTPKILLLCQTLRYLATNLEQSGDQASARKPSVDLSKFPIQKGETPWNFLKNCDIQDTFSSQTLNLFFFLGGPTRREVSGGFMNSSHPQYTNCKGQLRDPHSLLFSGQPVFWIFCKPRHGTRLSMSWWPGDQRRRQPSGHDVDPEFWPLATIGKR